MSRVDQVEMTMPTSHLKAGDYLRQAGNSAILHVVEIEGPQATVRRFTGNRHERRKVMKTGGF